MRRDPHNRLALAAALVAVAALAGCGGGELSKSEYEQKVQSAWADVLAGFRSPQGGEGGIAARAESAEDALNEAADELDGVDAPKAVEEQNDELVQAMRGYADDLGELREAIEDRDEDRIRAFNEGVAQNRWVRQIQEVVEQMKAKGYDLGAIAQD